MTTTKAGDGGGSGKPPEMPNPFAERPDERIAGLSRLIDVQPAEAVGRYRGLRVMGGVGRVYGGQVVAQALAAAAKSAPADRMVHSLHCYFLRGGSEDHEIDFEVEADFDGGSFSNRRVIARQQGEVIFNLSASFHVAEPGHFHQVQMPDAPEPEGLKTVTELARETQPDLLRGMMERILLRPSPFEIRPLDGTAMLRVPSPEWATSYWFRTVAPISPEQWLQRAMLAYQSDWGILAAAIGWHGAVRAKAASLDHNIWFHSDCRVDEWMLFHLESPWAGGARGLGRGQIFDRSGRLIASVAQEGLMRDRSLRPSP